MIDCTIKKDGPSVEINISCSNVVVLSLFRGHVLILFIAENALSQSADCNGKEESTNKNIYVGHDRK